MRKLFRRLALTVAAISPAVIVTVFTVSAEASKCDEIKCMSDARLKTNIRPI